jgi:hypothetical protein
METTFETTNLIAEVQRYLAAVEMFRAEGCDPRWSPELVLHADESEAAAPGIHRSWLERG